MRFLDRTTGETPRPELDARLHDIFDDRKTPGAPDALYSYLCDVPTEFPMNGAGRFGAAWHSLGRAGRVAASLAVVVVVGAGILAVATGLPRTTTGGSSSPSTGPQPSTPAAPSGWHFQGAFWSAGPDGLWVSANVLPPARRIAIHVVCQGPDEVIVLASTSAGTGWLEGDPTQAVSFSCDMSGREGRVELTSANGDFQEIAAIVARNPASLVDTTFVVSVEVRDSTPAPSK